LLNQLFLICGFFFLVADAAAKRINDAIDEEYKWYLRRLELSEKDIKARCKQLLLQDTQIQFYNYAVLKKYLENPRRLPTQTVVHLSYSAYHFLLEEYYSIPPDVALQFIGIKFHNKRKRKDVETPGKIPPVVYRRLVNTSLSYTTCSFS
jgi:hypothetical protein